MPLVGSLTFLSDYPWHLVAIDLKETQMTYVCRWIIGMIFFLSVLGCSSVDSRLHQEEVTLGTDSGNAEQFHALVYYSKEHALRYPGLIVGIEKSSAKPVKDEARNLLIQSLNSNSESKKTDEWLVELLKDTSKSMFISHIVDSSKVNVPTLVYNAYECQTERAGSDKKTTCPGYDSWKAIAQVKEKLEAALERTPTGEGQYTHVIFLTMGWNTNQVEAVQNFNSLVRELSANAAPRSFHPYVVGVTWPSQWDSGFFGDVYRGSSLGNKANDADEIGAGWLGAVLRYGVLPVTRDSKTKLIVIGHSFGARATSHAVCRGTLLVPQDKQLADSGKPMKGDVHWLIGLQGAYSLNRFSTKGAGIFEKISYDPKCEVADNLLLTASKHDSAGKYSYKVLGAPFAGSIGTWNSVLKDPGILKIDSPSFDLYKTRHVEGDENTSVCLEGRAGSHTRSFNYVDASEVIKFNAYGTGAGAHSDIYRAQTAKLMWEFLSGTLISRCAEPSS